MGAMQLGIIEDNTLLKALTSRDELSLEDQGKP